MYCYAVAPGTLLSQEQILELTKLAILRQSFLRDQERSEPVTFDSKTHKAFLTYLRQYEPECVAIYQAWRLDQSTNTLPARIALAYQGFQSRVIQYRSMIEDFELEEEDGDILFGRIHRDYFDPSTV